MLFSNQFCSQRRTKTELCHGILWKNEISVKKPKTMKSQMGGAGCLNAHIMHCNCTLNSINLYSNKNFTELSIWDFSWLPPPKLVQKSECKISLCFALLCPASRPACCRWCERLPAGFTRLPVFTRSAIRNRASLATRRGNRRFYQEEGLAGNDNRMSWSFTQPLQFDKEPNVNFLFVVFLFVISKGHMNKEKKFLVILYFG